MTSVLGIGGSFRSRASPRVTTRFSSISATRCSISRGPSGTRTTSSRRTLPRSGATSTRSAFRTVGCMLCPDPVTQSSPPARTASRMSCAASGAESCNERFGNTVPVRLATTELGRGFSWRAGSVTRWAPRGGSQACAPHVARRRCPRGRRTLRARRPCRALERASTESPPNECRVRGTLVR
jgi:hypothetical protein